MSSQQPVQFTIDLKPLPVSKAWLGRRFKSPAYKKWEKDVQWFVPKNKELKGNVEVTVELFLKNDKRSDIDNPLKTLMDALTRSGIYEDDSRIYALHVYKQHDTHERIRVTISNF